MSPTTTRIDYLDGVPRPHWSGPVVMCLSIAILIAVSAYVGRVVMKAPPVPRDPPPSELRLESQWLDQ